MQCREFREIADSYLSNELIVETNHEVISHLEQCAECRPELAARRELRSQLREAFIKAPENQMRPEFADRLSTQLHDYALGKRRALIASPRGWRTSVMLRRTSWLALAACLVLAVGFGLVLLRQRMLGRSPQQDTREVAGREPTPNYPAELNPRVPVTIVKTELARDAAGDHRDCAIHFRLAEKPIDLEVAGREYDPVYINLTKAMLLQQGDAPLNAQFVEAHSCVFEGRRFAHIILKYHGRLVSFLVTDIGGAKQAKTNAARMPADLQQQVIACSQFDGYQVSCFQTARHAIFIVSDLPEGDNLALARALAPSVFAHITRSENEA
jgi:anti-sigma factor RsiW